VLCARGKADYLCRMLRRETDPPRAFAELGWPGRRFRVLRDLGEPRDFSILHYQDGNLTWAERNIRHEDHDGVGAVVALLRERGVQPTIPTVTPPALGFTRWRLLWRFLQYNRTVVSAPIRLLKTKPDTERAQQNHWPAASMWMLDAADTSTVVAGCRARQATVTSWLLSTLDEVCAPLLLQPGSPRTWMVPVSLRTPTSLDEDNAVGAMMLPFYENRTAQELKETIGMQVRDKLAFGPAVFVRWLMKKSEAQLRAAALKPRERRHLFGLLTNIGTWPAPAGDDGTWVLDPPVSRMNWLACSVLSVGGRLGVCLKVHGVMGVSSEQVHDMLHQVHQRMVAFVGAPLPSARCFIEPSTAREEAK
jgi:hypothetical protein